MIAMCQTCKTLETSDKKSPHAVNLQFTGQKDAQVTMIRCVMVSSTANRSLDKLQGIFESSYIVREILCL